MSSGTTASVEMAERMQVTKDFVTPDRAGPAASAKRSMSPAEDDPITSTSDNHVTGRNLNTVTPMDSTARPVMLSSDGKHELESPVPISINGRLESPLSDHERLVRFGACSDKRVNKDGDDPMRSADSSATTKSSQNIFTSRPAATPDRPAKKSSEQAVLEFKTYRSPPRKNADSNQAQALSMKSSGLVIASSLEPKGSAACAPTTSSKTDEKKEDETPSQQRDTDTKSPLNAMESSTKNTDTLRPSSNPSEKENSASSEGQAEEAQEVRQPLNSSPQPSRESVLERTRHLTPARSPTGNFQNLPSLDDALKSPVGLFLSPHPPTPGKPFGEKDKKESDSYDHSKFTFKSPRTRDMERERFVATPTDFGVDFGKGHPNSGPFDSSNVLAWLQSPTANGLFSPGGFGSILNTPRSAQESRTPRTPNVSTSFFFSDVAGLPRSSDFVSPKPNEGGKKGSNRGYSNIICISPLASSKGRNGAPQSSNTPINFKDVFASPNEKSRSRHLSTDGDTNKSNIDSVHMAERDILEDKDLSVLMQLASSATPRSSDGPAAVSTSGGSDVFRPPIVESSSAPRDNLPGLQLPRIGGSVDGHSARLSRKTHSRGAEEVNSTFSSDSTSGTRADGSRTGANVSRKSDRKNSSSHSTKEKMHPGTQPPYPMPPPYPPHPGTEMSYFPHLPPGMPPNGSMRVVVGAPRPPKVPSAHVMRPGSPSMGSHPYPPGMGDACYPHYPPPGHYHPGMPRPHVTGMRPPFHYPQRPPVPIYGSQPPHPPTHAKSKPSKKKSSTKGSKRPLVSAPSSTAKNNSTSKKPKSSSPSGPPKKKNKSPQLTDKSERQKAAATIQAVNAASGGKNDRAAALAAAILRGVTMRPSGKWQAQLYFAGKSRYIGVFDSREKAALAYEIAREKLKSEKVVAESEGGLTPKATEAAVNAARKAAFEGVNEHDPRHT